MAETIDHADRHREKAMPQTNESRPGGRRWLNPTISFGNMIELAAIAVAAVAAYYTLKYDVSSAGETAARAESTATKNSEHIRDLATDNAKNLNKTLESVNRLTTNVEVLSRSMKLRSEMQEKANERMELDIRDLKSELRRATP